MRPPRQEGVTEALLEFHKKSPESRGDFFFFFLIYPSWPYVAPVAQPRSSSTFLSLEVFTPGKAFLGGSPPLGAPAEQSPGVVQGEQNPPQSFLAAASPSL